MELPGAAPTQAMLRRSQQTLNSKPGEEVEIIYGGAVIDGFLSSDDITIGEMTVKEQLFIEATKERGSFFQFTTYDGILGLGFKENSITQSDPIWYNMAAQHLVQQQVFSIWLKYYKEQDEEGGSIVFGGYDETHFRGTHTYVPVTQQVYWEFEMTELLIGEQGTGHCIHGCPAAVDSGASVVSGPRSIVETIYKAIGADEIASVNCNNVPSMPTVSFTIGGRVFPLSPRDYIEKNGEECSTKFRINRSNDANDEDLWYLGVVFMRPYHTIFDYGNLQIGFAEAVQE